MLLIASLFLFLAALLMTTGCRFLLRVPINELDLLELDYFTNDGCWGRLFKIISSGVVVIILKDVSSFITES